MFKGIFKTRNGWIEKIDSDYSKANIRNIIFEQSTDGNYQLITDPKMKLKTKEFRTKGEKNKYIKEYKDLKDIMVPPEELLYVSQKYFENNKFKKPRIFYVDIETIDLNYRIFPEPLLAPVPVTHIQILDSETDKVIIIYTKEPSDKLKAKWKDVSFIKCETENEMFEKFSVIINKIKPDIMTAYNGDKFDYPYLYFRAKKIGFDFDLLSPLHESKMMVELELKNMDLIKANDGKKYKKFYDYDKLQEYMYGKTYKKDFKVVKYKITINGIYLIDYLDVYKKFTYGELSSYTFENVTFVELKEGEGKVSYKEFNSIFDFYEKDYDGFFDYSIMDVVGLRNLENKKKFLSLTAKMGSEFGCNWDLVLGTVQPWMARMTHYCLKHNFVLPNDHHNKLDTPIGGGYVRDPIFGLSAWYYSIDYNSLYPSIKNALNICPSTYIKYEDMNQELKDLYDLYQDEDETRLLDKKEFERVSEICERNDVIFGGTAFYRKDTRGFIAELMDSDYALRKVEKNKMLLANVILKSIKDKKPNELKYSSVNTIIEDIESGKITWDNVYTVDALFATEEDMNILEVYKEDKDASQMAKKIALNSLYGALGTMAFVLFNRDIAASITFTGRFLIQKSANEINELMDNFYKSKNIPNKYGNVIYGDTDSVYFGCQAFVEKLESSGITNRREKVDKVLSFIDKIIQPKIDKIVNECISGLNYYHQGFMGAKVEKVGNSAVFVAKKKYATAKLFEEGTYYDEPALSVTGLDVVRSSTPPFAKEVLGDALELILLKDEKTLQDYFKEAKEKFYIESDERVDTVARASGVTSLDYVRDHTGYFRIVNEVKDGRPITRRVGAPINSTASMTHNDMVEKFELGEQFPMIEEGNKIKYVFLKTPNPTGFPVVGFQDSKMLYSTDLIKYLDKETIYEKIIYQPMKIILDKVGWSMEQKTSLNSLGFF